MAVFSLVQTIWDTTLPVVQDPARLLVTWRASASGPPVPVVTVYNAALWSASSFPLSESLITAGMLDWQSFTTSQGTIGLDLNGRTRLINTLPLQALTETPPDYGPASQMRSSATIWADRTAFSGAALAVHQAGDFLFVSERYGSGLTVYAMTGALPSRVTTLADNGVLRLEGIVAMTSIATDSGLMLIVASQTTNSLSVLRVGAGGSLEPLSVIGTDMLLPVYLPSQIGTARLNGQNFVLLGSAGSSSLTVLRLSADGSLTYLDQTLDSRDTRFAGLTAMDILTLNGLVLVAVAGHDGGVSLFQLLPSGRLLLRGSFEDQLDTALQNVVDLRFVVVGNRVELFAIAAGDRGVTRLVLDPGQFGPAVGGLVSTATTGTDGNDVLTAPRGGALVQAGNGDDILISGDGSDTLDGGAGADVFTLLPDTSTRDIIRNFALAEDRIDMSAFPQRYSLDALTVKTTPIGAELRFGETRIIIQAGQSLTAEMLRPVVWFNSGHVVISTPVPASSDIPAGNGAKTAYWVSGPWVYDGSDDLDTVDYSAAPTGAIIDLQGLIRNAGAATGHLLFGIAHLIGTASNDQFKGDATNNRLYGYSGNDSLEGRDGDDWINPGSGHDTIDGGAGNDTISFGAAVNANLLTGLAQSGTQTDALRGIEHVAGSDFDDIVTGDARPNAIWGNAGNDWITPGGGADWIDGGDGIDMVSFVDAPTPAVIDLAAATAVIGTETDRIYRLENVTGTIFADLITGDAGANRIRAMGNYDWMVGSGGNDTFEGGTGRDTVAYSAAPSGVVASLLTDSGTGGQATGDRYVDIENLTGSSYADLLAGDNDRNILRAMAGDDFIYGHGDRDTIDGGPGRDTIDGGAGNDRITGGRGNDVILGGQGYDVALFSGTRAQYSLADLGGERTSVLHTAGGIDGVDIVSGIEVLQFSDGRLFL